MSGQKRAMRETQLYDANYILLSKGTKGTCHWLCCCPLRAQPGAGCRSCPLATPGSYCQVCPEGSGWWRVHSDGCCGNKKCRNYGDRRKNRWATERGEASNFHVSPQDKKLIDKILSHVEDVDANGHRIVALRFRPDIIALADAHALLIGNSIGLEDRIFLCGFLHIVYWSWPAMMCVTLFLDIVRREGIKSWVQLDARKAYGLLKEIGNKMHDWMADLCCKNGEQLIQRAAKRKFPGDGFPNPTQNPMARQGSRQHWDALLSDVKSGAWQAAASEMAKEISKAEVAKSSEKAEVSYHDLYEVLHCRNLTLYSGTKTGSVRHYLSVHYLRALLFSLELQSDQSEKDWCIFSNMGSGTRSNVWNIHSYDLAKYCCRRMGQKLPTYGLEDLACFLCMAQKA